MGREVVVSPPITKQSRHFKNARARSPSHVCGADTAGAKPLPGKLQDCISGTAAKKLAKHKQAAGYGRRYRELLTHEEISPGRLLRMLE